MCVAQWHKPPNAKIYCLQVSMMNNASNNQENPADLVEDKSPSQLYPEDMERVQKYLSSPIHSVERKPFRPWILIAGVWVLIVALGLLSLAISRFVLG